MTARPHPKPIDLDHLPARQRAATTQPKARESGARATSSCGSRRIYTPQTKRALN